MNIVLTNQFYFHYEIIESIIEQYDTICKINKNPDDNIYLFIHNNPQFVNYITNKYPSIKITTFPFSSSSCFTKNISYIPHTYDKYITDVVKYDYYIDCTTFNTELIRSHSLYYDKSILKPHDNKHYYIYHHSSNDKAENIIYVSPIFKDKGRIIQTSTLPFTEEIKRNKTVPIYIINGGISPTKRYYVLLKRILSKRYNKPFIIKIIGYKYGTNNNIFIDEYGDKSVYPDTYEINYPHKIPNNKENVSNKPKFANYKDMKRNGYPMFPYIYLPCVMNPTVNIIINDKSDNINEYLPSCILERVKEESINNATIIYNIDFEFIDFHKEFLDAYCIIPLITKDSHPHYYDDSLTATINYGLAYKLKFLIDKDLNDIYQLDDNVLFNDEYDIIEAFEKTLNCFYEDT